MSEGTPDRLFQLLPAVHRVSDAARGGVLQALLGVIQEEFERLEADIERLHDNWFIETCDEWVVPYIGDLLGVQALLPVEDGVFSQRAFVANTLAYRRAKGTAAVLEQLARDVTGWPAKAVEYFDLLATTRSMNHARRSDVSTVEVRDANRAELAGSPLERAAHTGEVRHIDNGRGRYNIPNVGLHLWRLQPYYLTRATARPVGLVGGQADRFTFDPAGATAPLFNVPRAETAMTQLAAEANVPGRLRRRPLRDELEARRQALVDGDEPEGLFFDDSQPVLRLWIERAAAGTTFLDEVKPEELLICDLGDRPAPEHGWARPPDKLLYQPSGGGGKVARPIKAAVDPVRGRIALPAGKPSGNVEVTYAYGFPGDLGGGPYNRRASVAKALPDPGEVTWQVGVTRDPPAGADELRASLLAAVDEWNQLEPGAVGVIALLDSRSHQGRYQEDLHAEVVDIEVKAGSRLLIVAADWPFDLQRDELGRQRRFPGRLTPDDRRPHLSATIRVRGTAPPGASPGRLAIDGLLIEGDVTVLPGNLGELRLSHSTVVPGVGRLTTLAGTPPGEKNNQLSVTLQRAISGPVSVDARAARLRVTESIVDGRSGDGATVAGPDTEIVASTVLGATTVRSLYASNSILTRQVEAERRQTGCVRYSFLPPGSRVPRPFRCVPGGDDARGLAPAFTSTEYGQPAYGQLAATSPPQIAQGADDEGELGAFHFLQQPKRVANLTARLGEYLRFGLEAGVFYVT
jgi:hypothetical protein